MYARAVCEQQTDLVFVLDGSGSVNYYNNHNWATMLAFVGSVVQRFTIGQNQVCRPAAAAGAWAGLKNEEKKKKYIK